MQSCQTAHWFALAGLCCLLWKTEDERRSKHQLQMHDGRHQGLSDLSEEKRKTGHCQCTVNADWKTSDVYVYICYTMSLLHSIQVQHSLHPSRTHRWRIPHWATPRSTSTESPGFQTTARHKKTRKEVAYWDKSIPIHRVKWKTNKQTKKWVTMCASSCAIMVAVVSLFPLEEVSGS